MKKHMSISSLASLLAVAVLATLSLRPVQSGSEATAGGTNRSWPPPPTRIVSFASRLSNLDIPPRGFESIYTVPPDAYFVMTDLCLRRFTHDQDASWLHVRELKDGVLVRKIGRGVITSGWSAEPPSGAAGYHSTLGTVFSPGSEVVLMNDPLSPITITEVRIEFLDGYLVRAD